MCICLIPILKSALIFDSLIQDGAGFCRLRFFAFLGLLRSEIRKYPETYTNFQENHVQIVKEDLQYSQKKFIVNAIPNKSGSTPGYKQDVMNTGERRRRSLKEERQCPAECFRV